MTGKTDSEENAILSAAFRNTAYVQDDPVYIGLFSTMPGDDGTGGVELSGNGYARIAVETGANSEWNAPSGGVVDNTNLLEWTASGGNWVEAVGVGIFSALTAGTLRRFAWLGNQSWVFTAANTGDLFTAPGHSLANDDRVVLQGRLNSTIPTGVTANTIYYVIGVSGETFQLSATQGGAAIALTADGGGSVKKILPRQIDDGGKMQFAAGALDITES